MRQRAILHSFIPIIPTVHRKKLNVYIIRRDSTAEGILVIFRVNMTPSNPPPKARPVYIQVRNLLVKRLQKTNTIGISALTPKNVTIIKSVNTMTPLEYTGARGKIKHPMSMLYKNTYIKESISAIRVRVIVCASHNF